MVKPSDLLKLFLVIHFVEFYLAIPLGDEASYDSGYDQGVVGWVPVPASYTPQSSYWPLSPFQSNRIYPSYNERLKALLTVPSKRNSELINSLLGLPKNMDDAGK